MKTRLTAVIGALALGAVAVQAYSADSDNLGQHPAVLVAQKWATRGIDPNTFIVLHPAGPRWLAASPTAPVAAQAHSATADNLGQHPAVLVAQKWATRGIDPNTFIVLHPAEPRWLAASPTARVAATRDIARPAAPVARSSK